MCSRFTIVFPAESNQKQFTGKEYYQRQSAGFYQRRLAAEIERLVLHSGPRRGWRWPGGCLPAAVRLRRERHHRISQWHLPASLKVTVITAVTRDMSPRGDPPKVDAVSGGTPPRVV